MSFIEAKNVYYRYPQAEKDALCGVSFAVEKGEYLAVIGHNGSGKSTLARLLNGLLQPTEGEISVGGISSADKSRLFELRRRVGVVFQNPDNQLIASVVEDDVAFGPENIGLKREEIKERIDFALAAVGMEEYRKAMPSRLSGGQKQRVAIAGVLAIRPDVLVLDESTAMLDPRGRREVTDVVKKLNRENGMTVLAVTHYMDEVCDADRVLVLSDGAAVMEGTPREIFSQKEKLQKYELDVPVPMRIAELLKEGGMPLKEIFTKEELGEELCRLLRKI